MKIILKAALAGLLFALAYVLVFRDPANRQSGMIAFIALFLVLLLSHVVVDSLWERFRKKK